MDAKKENLDRLLEYLGDRAGDFEQCFDMDSEWCWKYAALVMRGLEKRHHVYAERHHIVPRCFYGLRKDDRRTTEGNMTTLSFTEHVLAHFYLAMCAKDGFRVKMAVAFSMMYGFSGKLHENMMPGEDELLEELPELEVNRIRSASVPGSRIDDECRTHYFENPEAAKREGDQAYYTRNRDEIRDKQNQKYADNREAIREQRRAEYAENKGGVRDAAIEYQKAYREEHPELVAQRKHDYYENNADKVKAKVKKWQQENPEKVRASRKKNREENPERYNSYSRKWKKEHRTEVLAAGKEYREKKIAAGFRFRKDPVTGKRHWIFVGNPTAAEAA